MSQRVITLNLSDRIAQLVAFEMMRKLAWSNQPELLQFSTPELLEYRRDYARFLVKFEIPRVKGFVYQVMVIMHGCEGGWQNGSIYALHGSVQTVYFYTTFRIEERDPETLSDNEEDLVVVIEKDYLTKAMDYEAQILFEL